MGRGSSLTEEEKIRIQVHAENGLSTNAIVQRIGRSRCVVANFLKSPKEYGTNYNTKNNTKLTNRDKRQIIRLASTSGQSSSSIRSD
ncbi:hypothetical protein BLOT_008807 [Blomia tropicalis]|nr:hypothetical protein BLOT_008807 [Blomia tropicalis]